MIKDSIVRLETTNPTLCRFYEKHSYLNFELINLVFIEVLEKLMVNITTDSTSEVNSILLSNINENTKNINDIKTTINNLKDSITLFHTDITNNVLIKFIDIKKEYIDELKMIISNNTYEKITPLIEKHNDLLIDKTTNIMNEIIPKNQEKYYSQIHEYIQNFHQSISDDTRKMLKYMDNNSIKEFLNNFEFKSSMMLQNMQQPIYQFISASEDRIQTNISSLKDSSPTSQQMILNDNLIKKLDEFLQNNSNKTINSSPSNNLENVINKIYNTSDIINITNLGSSFPRNSILLPESSQEFIIKRPNKPKIYVESKSIDKNISSDDINKFIQNVESNNSHGVFLSQNSGFSTKSNYLIETINGFITIYVHNVNYQPEKIKLAIDIIDNLSIKMKEHKINEFENVIDKEVLDEINKEYQLFIQQKEIIINTFKDTQKKLISQIEDFSLPSLDKYLGAKFSKNIQKQGFKCDICKIFNANNLKALAAHKRGCTRKNVFIPQQQIQIVSSPSS